jgi:hypothetical protein
MAGESARSALLSTASQAPSAIKRRTITTRISLVAVGALLLLGWLLTPSGRRDDLERSLADCLSRDDLVLKTGQVVWLESPNGPFAFTPALLVARRAGELDDIYYADVRVDGGGTVFDVWGLTNITRSSSAAEGQLLRSGPYVAFSVNVGKQVDAVGLLDLRGEPEQLTAGWPLRARAQNAITNLQETGRLRGFGRRHYRLLPPARVVTLSAKKGRVLVRADADRVVLAPPRLRPVTGGHRVDAQETQKAQPGVITWVVDTVRNVPWIGAEPIAWLEHTVFGVTDRARRMYHGLVGTDTAELRDALGVSKAAPKAADAQLAPADVGPQASVQVPEFQNLLHAAEPDAHLPPGPVAAVLPDRVSGEGEWIAIADDPFVNSYPNAPAAFYQTFLRVDPERPFASVYITLWDPRQVQLHVAMGTKEPESATGETGLGLVPREPGVMGKIVGAFNGGFQALHGEFGAMAEGRVYLPPKPYAATVAVMDDGRVGMGSWPGPGKEAWDEARANAQIPPSMISLRQNLTSIVEDGNYNPWLRWWWGAAPEDTKEQTFIARSGLCLTREGHLAFLWGESMGPEELGKAMLALDCRRGMHLDMNSKHTGLEFYRPFAPAETMPELGRGLEGKEFEGTIDAELGYRFRARLAIKTMSPMRFPRYLLRDPRDFFYLTLKPVLPGPQVRVDGQNVSFSVRGLPSAGWPAAFARASIGRDAAAQPLPADANTEMNRQPGGASAEREVTWLVRIDPARAVPSPLPRDGLGAALGRLVGMPAVCTGPLALYATRAHGLLRYGIGLPPSGAAVLLRGQQVTDDSPTVRALGLDADGFLIYAEAPVGDAGQLARRLREAGVETSIGLPEGARLAFAVDGQWVSVDGTRVLGPAQDEGLAFWSEVRPAADVMFSDTKPLPYYKWAAVQNQRVRYFPSGAPRFRAPEDAFKAPPAAPPNSADPAVPFAVRP